MSAGLARFARQSGKGHRAVYLFVKVELRSVHLDKTTGPLAEVRLERGGLSFNKNKIDKYTNKRVTRRSESARLAYYVF